MCKVIEDFKISLIEEGKSAKTIESYFGDIRAFIEFLGDKGVEFKGNLTTILRSKLQELSSRE